MPHFSNINIIVKLVIFMCTVYNPESNSFLRGIEFNKNCWKQSIYVCNVVRILEIISFISYVRYIGRFFFSDFFLSSLFNERVRKARMHDEGILHLEGKS